MKYMPSVCESPLTAGRRDFAGMDDDSLLTRRLGFDPFRRMQERDLKYVWRRDAEDRWGIDKLWKVAKPRVLPKFSKSKNPNDWLKEVRKFPLKGQWISLGKYRGAQPYNNFHISRVDMWQRADVQALWKDANDAHLFMKFLLASLNLLPFPLKD
jgi:hypothetical protein